MTSLVINVPGEYASLGLVMQSALEQASRGKGKERHAEDGEAYEDQIICEVARRVGLGYPLGQAVKKIYESQRLIPQLGVQELLGAMNYLAAAVIVMQERMEEEGRRFREGFAHAEGGCCKNGKDQSEASAEPEFKPGDRVQARLGDGVWRDAEVTGKEITCRKLYYTVKVADFNGYYSLQADDVRPAPKAEGCEEPEFKPGDSLLVTMPEGEDVHCVYIGESTHPGCCCVRYESGDLNGETDDTVPIDQIRREPAPKAEGCEELVQKDLHEDCEGCLYKTYADSHAEEHDAPRTPEETCQRIVDSNPATYERTHRPTGEELAEMAEEETHG